MHLPSQPGIPHLHSTMLLLYLEQPDEMGAYDRIYIPLCFYFIAWPQVYGMIEKLNLHSTMLLLYPLSVIHHNLVPPLFTFHYASTLS